IPHKKEKGLAWYPVKVVNEGFFLQNHLLFELEKGDKNQNSVLQNGGPVVLYLVQDGKGDKKEILFGTLRKLKEDSCEAVFSYPESPDWIDEPRLCLELAF